VYGIIVFRTDVEDLDGTRVCGPCCTAALATGNFKAL